MNAVEEQLRAIEQRHGARAPSTLPPLFLVTENGSYIQGGTVVESNGFLCVLKGKANVCLTYNGKTIAQSVDGVLPLNDKARLMLSVLK